MTTDHWDTQNKKGLMNKEVTLRFNLGRILKLLFIVCLLVGVFFIGRWSQEQAGEEKSAVAVDKGPNFLERLFARDESPDEPKTVAQTEVIESNTAKNSSNQSSTPPTPAPSTPAPVVATPAAPANVTAAPAQPETIITAYPSGTMAMTLTGVKKEWFETWGRINILEVSFRNNAQGTIKPSYITMIVEGYDYDKKVPLANGDPIVIKAGQTKSLFVTVPGGWAYNKVTAGDLKSVQVTIVLFDEADVQMASDRKEMNLEG